MPPKATLAFEGHAAFRQRLVMATLTGRTVRIDRIRADDEDQPGLRDFEVNFLRLLEKVTNGTAIEINYTGTAVVYRPGVITGGKLQHDCPASRAIGYFLEALIPLAPFAKKPFDITLTGVTNDAVDVSVDRIRTVLLPNLRRHMNLDADNDSLELRILKRGAPPLGGGEVRFACPVLRSLKPVQFTEPGRIKRIRGIAYATRMSPQMANRIVEASRGKLTTFIPDVYVYTDVYKGDDSGRSPGYGLTLVAESTTGALLSADCAFSKPAKQEGDGKEEALPAARVFETPEELGEYVTNLLLEEIAQGGCVDSTCQWLTLLLMAAGPEDVSKVRLGSLTDFSVQYLRDIRTIMNVRFKIAADPANGTVLLSCLGSGLLNISKSAV
ncbi:RNA 3'-terminal phosphate cyclase/enolpyruvate transferase [Hyaloraphidium curvatum]|nr:RNA 3'-terminal phosphate cyclase/enolpyruvate transferase [Hyaloraphidium curvatum]